MTPDPMRDPIHDGLLAEALAASAPRWRMWEPAAPLAVLGRSNEAARECDLAACRRLGVPVHQRRGGGGAVVLAPGMLVVTLAGPQDPGLGRLRVVERVHDWIVGALEELGVVGLERRGLGDLALAGRKVLGSSLAFSGGFVLYQGCLLVDADPAPIAACLHHPSREPEYRDGRPHEAFLTTLARAGHPLEVAALGARLEAGLDAARVTEMTSGRLPRTTPTARRA